MRRFTWTSAAAGTMIGVLAVAGGVAAPSAPAHALASACQIANDTDVAIQGVTESRSTVSMPQCQSGKGSRVRVDVRIRHAMSSNLVVWVIAPDGSQRKVQDGNVAGAVDLDATYRWTTSATSSKGTWTLKVWDGGVFSPGGLIDSWKVWVIPGSCWRVNDDDVTSPAGWNEGTNATNQWGPIYLWHPPTPVSTSVSSACTGLASADMRVRVLLRDVYRFEHHQPQWREQLVLYRNGVQVPTTIISRTVTAQDGDYQHQDIVVGVDGSSLPASGTWTLEVRTAAGPDGMRGITMDQWELHTSY